tara:strand:+ start:2106 stop:2663 length:558 start_codon:yes stop_codon:yes gene_type:complete
MKIKRITFAIISSIMIFSCGNPKSEKKTESEIIETKSEPTNLEKLEKESSRLRAGGSIKKVDFKNGKATIEYVKDYNEYKELNPQSGLTKSDLDNYWSSGDAVEKALVDGSVRLMKKLDFLDQVEIILPNKGKEYSINVKKSELEKFVGSDFNTIKNNWDEKFSNPFVYNDNGRQKFFAEFGKRK